MNKKKELRIKGVYLNENQVLIKELFEGNNINKENITIVDSIMGSGKTSWSIEKMKHENEIYMYITPFLDEIERVRDCLEGIRHLYTPTVSNEYGSKKYDFYNHVKSGHNVISTHALFRNCNKEILDYIKLHDYVLILDEVMDIVEVKKLSKADYDMLLETNSINISDNGKVEWLNDNYTGSFDWVKEYALSGQLYKHSSEDTDKVAFFAWQFPHEVFKYFKEVYILTYLFDGQIQKYYFDMHKLQYQYKQVQLIEGKYTLVDYDKENEYKHLREFTKKINIYEGKLNNIGADWYNFSSSYFKKTRNSKQIKQLKKNTENYMQHIARGKSEFNMWTTFKDCRSKLKGKGFSNGFIAVNARATNKYAHKINLAYLSNRFLQPYEVNYFKGLGINIDENLWALSELVQWIWRSAIRNNEAINIYIPSSRMRSLLTNWLSCGENESDNIVA